MSNTSQPLNQPPMIIFTDLDGTLLDHHTYQWQAAEPILQKLNNLNIPVIFNTSKTAAELRWWRQKTHNQHPFIVENGSALYFPKGYLKDNSMADLNQLDEFDCIVLGTKRDKILDWLSTECQNYKSQYTGFNELDVNQLISLTQLPKEQAELALQRDYSEAIHWHGSETDKQAFINKAQAAGWKVLIGGRFLHLLGQTDKGNASKKAFDILSEQTEFPNVTYANKVYSPLCVACGDSDNDIDMLDWADVAVVIKSPTKPPPTIQNKQVIYSQHLGPTGWNEVLSHLLHSIH